MKRGAFQLVASQCRRLTLAWIYSRCKCESVSPRCFQPPLTSQTEVMDELNAFRSPMLLLVLSMSLISVRQAAAVRVLLFTSILMTRWLLVMNLLVHINPEQRVQTKALANKVAITTQYLHNRRPAIKKDKAWHADRMITMWDESGAALSKVGVSSVEVMFF